MVKASDALAYRAQIEKVKVLAWLRVILAKNNFDMQD